MLLAMFWQSLAVAGLGTTGNALADPAHATLHWQEEGHHHHDDGSYHQDDSTESVQHGLTDHLNPTLALAAPSSRGFLPAGCAAPPGRHETLVPHPILDGLLRPPRSRA